MARSIWTHEERDDLVEIRLPPANTSGLPPEQWETHWVEPEHVDDVKRIQAKADRVGPYGLLALLLVFPASVPITLLFGPRPLGAIVCAVGAWLWLNPLPTPQTSAAIGLRDAVRLARVGAVVLVGLGVWVLVAAP
jgi:hypothetical protein